MAADLEPIDININLKQNVGEEAGKASQGMNGMAAASKELQETIDLQKKAIADLEKEYAKAKAAFDKVNIGTSDAELIKQKKEAAKIYHEVNAELTAEKKALAELEASLEKTVKSEKKATQSASSYMAQMRQVRNEMAQLRGATGVVAPEDMQRYEELKAKLKELATAYKLVNEEKKALTTGTNGTLSGLAQGGSGIAGILTAGGGVMSMFTNDSKRFAEIQTKLQSAIAITIGLQQASMALHSTSAFRLNVVNKLTTQWTNAQALLNRQLGISLGLSKALMIGGIGILIAGIALLVNRYQKMNAEQEEAARLNKIVSDSLKSAAMEGEKAAIKETTSLKLLYKASQDDSRSKGERIDAVKELQRLYPDYFANMSAEEIMAGNAAGAYDRLTTSIIAAAKARAYQDKIAENESKILDLEAKNAEKEEKKLDAEKKLKLAESRNSYERAANDPYAEGAMLMLADAADISAIKSEIRDYNKEINNSTKEIEKYRETNKKLAEGINASDLIYDSKKNKAAYDKAAKAGERDQKKIDDANEKLAKKAAEYEKRIAASRIAAMEEGAEKRKAAALAEFEETKRMIELERKELDDLEKITGKPASEQRDKLSILYKSSEDKYAVEIKKINENSRKAIDAIFADVNRKFLSELDNNLTSINRYYDDQVAKARAAGASIGDVEELNAARSRELNLAKIDNESSVLDFEQDIANRLMEISEKRYLFESDKLKAQILQEQEFAKKRLEIAQQRHDANPTEEAAQNLRDAEVALEEVNRKLKKLPEQKMREIANYAGMLAGSLEDITGLDFSLLTNAFDGISSIVSGDAMGAASAGLNIISGFIGGILNKKERESQIQRELNKLQQEYNISLRQQNFDLIDATDYIRIFRDNLEALNWLIEKGFISDVDYSAWEALNRQARLANDNIVAAQQSYDRLNAAGDVFLNEAYRLRNVEGWKKYGNIAEAWKSGIIDTEEALRRFTAAGWKGLGELADQIAAAHGETEKWNDEIAELSRQLNEFATGTSFDGFLSDAANAIRDMYGDITNLADFTEEALTNAILSSFKYQVLSNSLKPFYDELSDKFIKDFDNLDEAWGNDWKERLQAELGSKGKILEDLFASMGISPDGGDRRGTSAGIERISQDSANELNGNFYAIRQQVGDIRNLQREANTQRKSMLSYLARVVENTEYCRLLENMKNSLDDMQNRGIKIKV